MLTSSPKTPTPVWTRNLVVSPSSPEQRKTIVISNSRSPMKAWRTKAIQMQNMPKIPRKLDGTIQGDIIASRAGDNAAEILECQSLNITQHGSLENAQLQKWNQFQGHLYQPKSPVKEYRTIFPANEKRVAVPTEATSIPKRRRVEKAGDDTIPQRKLSLDQILGVSQNNIIAPSLLRIPKEPDPLSQAVQPGLWHLAEVKNDVAIYAQQIQGQRINHTCGSGVSNDKLDGLSATSELPYSKDFRMEIEAEDNENQPTTVPPSETGAPRKLNTEPRRCETETEYSRYMPNSSTDLLAARPRIGSLATVAQNQEYQSAIRAGNLFFVMQFIHNYAAHATVWSTRKICTSLTEANERVLEIHTEFMDRAKSMGVDVDVNFGQDEIGGRRFKGIHKGTGSFETWVGIAATSIKM